MNLFTEKKLMDLENRLCGCQGGGEEVHWESGLTEVNYGVWNG